MCCSYYMYVALLLLMFHFPWSYVLDFIIYDKLRLRHLVKCYKMLQVFFKSTYSKIPKISPGLMFFKGPFCRVYFSEGFLVEKLRSKIDWTSLWLEGNWCVIVLFLLCFILYLKTISKYKLQGSYIRRGVLVEGFLCYKFEGLIHEGDYFWNITVLPNYFVKKKNHLKGLPRESCEVVVKELIKITQDPISSLQNSPNALSQL